MAVLIKEIIPHLIAHQTDWRITLLAQWQAIMGTLQTRVRLEKIYDDTLIIGVYESHWMQELYLLSSVIIDSINTFLGEPRIAHLRFKLVEEKKKAVPSRKAGVLTRPQVVTLSVGQQSALNSIDDEQLKKALIDFWGRCSASSV